MPKKKTQKVRFHRGDKRPNSDQPSLTYTKKMKKLKKDIIWQVIEKPTNKKAAPKKKTDSSTMMSFEDSDDDDDLF